MSHLRRITVDLTPVVAGGDNGGAKVVARSLVHELAALAQNTEFILLTSARSHDDLAELDASNVRRQCVDVEHVPTSADAPVLAGARLAARTVVDTLLPVGARSRIKDGVWTLVKRHRRAQVASSAPADLHFCPFTAPFFFDPRVPLVSVVHDLQFLELPEFFEAEELEGRNRHFRDACARAERLICVSEFVRRSVLANSTLHPGSVVAIHSTVLHATEPLPEAESIRVQVLDRLGIRPGSRFLLYPANVWPHKNHRVLLDAFAHYLERSPDADLALVCTGAPSAAAREISALGERLLPAGTFAFAGYLPEHEFAALLQSCRALIFPSLYEGFGLPLLEAMACDRPVLCSNSTSLPEIAGDAALLFDPREVASISRAIEQLEREPDLEARLVERGRERVRQFGSAHEMAASYLVLFEEVASARARSGAR